MLSRQVAPLLRKFCKVSAYFTITAQRCHALTMLRRAHFGRLVNAADIGEKLPRISAPVFDTPN